jgi:hypothetical protein
MGFKYCLDGLNANYSIDDCVHCRSICSEHFSIRWELQIFEFSMDIFEIIYMSE